MMGALVDEERARLVGVGVPAAEVVGAVVGIEKIFQVDGVHAADGAGGEEFLDLAPEGSPAVVEGDADAAAGGTNGVEDGAAFLRVDCERFFGDDIAAGVQGADNVVMMGAIDRTDEDHVRMCGAQHLVEAVGGERGNGVAGQFAGEQCIVVGHARGAEVAQADKFVRVAIGRDERLDEADGAAAGANERVAGLGHGGRV